jgi:type II secretory pathway pseudopilin PulG
MFSLIITVISIALVAALALATLYYGGTAYSQAQANAKVSQIKNQAQQLLGAADLFYANKGRWPLTTQELVDERFLKSIPVAQTAMREALADASEWTMAVPEVPVFLLSTDIPEACRGINQDNLGQRGILTEPVQGALFQCYGQSLSTLTTVVSRNARFLEDAATTSGSTIEGVVLRTGPTPPENDVAWLVRPSAPEVASASSAAGGPGTTEPPAVVQTVTLGSSVLPGGTLGLNYNFDLKPLLQASGPAVNFSEVTWELLSGSVPGLTVIDGVLGGAPTSAQAQGTAAIRATYRGVSAEQAYSLGVTAGSPIATVSGSLNRSVFAGFQNLVGNTITIRNTGSGGAAGDGGHGTCGRI